MGVFLSEVSPGKQACSAIYMRSLCAKFLPSCFKTEGGDRGDRRRVGQTDRCVPAMQKFEFFNEFLAHRRYQHFSMYKKCTST